MPSQRAGASGIGTDRTKISQIEQHIRSEGAQVETLVERYNQVAGQMAAIKGKIASDSANLVGDHRAKAKVSAGLRSLAVNAYVSLSSGESATLSSFSNASSVTALTEKQEYLGIANTQLNQAITTYQVIERRTQITEGELRSKEAEIAATLTSLTSARSSAQSALTADDTTVSQLNHNLQTLVTVANEQRAAAEARQEEQRLAAEQLSTAQQPTTTAVTSPSAIPTPGSYANPLRSIGGLTPERIDQGVDYGGFGPIYAIGDGVVISTFNGGWPGGTFISYRLSDGPDNGLVVYAAEDIEPLVHVSQTVSANTVLGQMYEGSDGIETGWAGPSGDGVTMANTAGQFGGSNSTAFGYSFSQLLTSLGAPGGILQNNPPTGSLPSGWPA